MLNTFYKIYLHFSYYVWWSFKFLNDLSWFCTYKSYILCNILSSFNCIFCFFSLVVIWRLNFWELKCFVGVKIITVHFTHFFMIKIHLLFMFLFMFNFWLICDFHVSHTHFNFQIRFVILFYFILIQHFFKR